MQHKVCYTNEDTRQRIINTRSGYPCDRSLCPDLEEREDRNMAKLPQGTRKRSDGSFEKRFTIDGKRYSVYAPNTKELAEKEQELRNTIKEGRYKKNNSVTLDNYFKEWIERKEKTTKANTLNIYSNYYKKHISETLGKKKIKDIERREVQLLQNKLLIKLSPNTTNMIIKVLRAVLSDAVKDDIIERNVACGIKAIKETTKATDTYHRALTIQEQRTFMQALKSNYYYHYIALMLASGMRCGEVGALQWGDIDYKNNVIHVTKTITRDIDGKLIVGDSPKTDAGQRDIPLTDTIKQILKEHKQKSDILQFRTNNIFLTTRGYIMDNGIINRTIKNTLAEIEKNEGVKIEHFTSHALRDTFATRYIEQGGNMHRLQKILGHESITMTMDLYAHVLPNTLQEEMQKVVINI